MATGDRASLTDARCGVDMPPAGDGKYCPCVLPAGHEGPHEYKRGPHATQGFAWPHATNDPGLIWRIKE